MIDHIYLPVKDIDRSLQFYAALLTPLDFAGRWDFKGQGGGSSYADPSSGCAASTWAHGRGVRLASRPPRPRTSDQEAACNRQGNVTRVASCLPWAKPARAAGTRVAGSIWFVPIAARESASGVITSTRLPCLRRASTWLARSVPHSGPRPDLRFVEPCRRGVQPPGPLPVQGEAVAPGEQRIHQSGRHQFRIVGAVAVELGRFEGSDRRSVVHGELARPIAGHAADQQPHVQQLAVGVDAEPALAGGGRLRPAVHAPQ